MKCRGAISLLLCIDCVGARFKRALFPECDHIRGTVQTKGLLLIWQLQARLRSARAASFKLFNRMSASLSQFQPAPCPRFLRDFRSVRSRDFLWPTSMRPWKAIILEGGEQNRVEYRTVRRALLPNSEKGCPLIGLEVQSIVPPLKTFAQSGACTPCRNMPYSSIQLAQ